MERPKGMSKPHLKYVEYLEKKVKDFSSTTTKVKSYYALKKTVDGLNKLMLDGVEIDGKKHDLLSTHTLADKDDKIFDRFFKFIDKLESFLSTMDKLSSQISPDLVDKENYASEFEEVQAILQGKK